MSVHAMLNEPLLLRKDILESAIITTDVMKSFERIVELKDQRNEIKKQIINSLKELKKDVRDFEKRLPRIPKEERVMVTKSAIKESMLNDREEEIREELGGKIKDIEKVKAEIYGITVSDSKEIRRKLGATEERERFRRELASIRSRISRLGKLTSNDHGSFS